MTDDTTPPAERPAFDTLIAELRQEKLRKARRDGAANADAIMQKAHRLHAEGKISAADIAHLNAARIKLDEALP